MTHNMLAKTRTRILPLLILAVAGCGASPEEICDHQIEVVKKELGDDAAKELDRGECVKKYEFKKDMKGLSKWSKFSSCIMEADSVDALDKC